MTGTLDWVAAGWPVAATLALALVADRFHAGRRRSALNRSLHELRRPLQALALALPHPHGSPGASGTLEMAISALAQLDREINGGAAGPGPNRRRFDCRAVAAAAARRWAGRASVHGGSLELRWGAPGTVLEGDPQRLAQALDNLIVNAFEHGGPQVLIEASIGRGMLRLTVRDSGRATRPPGRSETPRETIARLTGRARHGHGLRVVRAVAREHGGRLLLRCTEGGSTAVLELPLARAAETGRSLAPPAA
jgi:signal transduction histidine kinase